MSEMNMVKEFRLTDDEMQLLQQLASDSVVNAQCLGPSIQDVVPEPGFFCQAIKLQTGRVDLILTVACEDFGSIEIFCLSIADPSKVEHLNAYANLPALELSKSAFGLVQRWEKIPQSVDFQNGEGQVIHTRADAGLLIHFENGGRFLVRTAPLAFFIQCFTDSAEIDAALADMW